jgi:hypothetical protein
MKILIAYYSRAGNTEKLAEVIKKELEGQGHSVDVEKVIAKKEHSILGWFFIRIFKGECEIFPPKIKDLSKYDAICIGSPNWTRLSLPMARYLKKVKGLEYKNVGFFATTALSPAFEWYVFSAYLLDWTFSKIIERKKGRVVESILLSSLFKRWGVDSEYGKREIKKLCDRITTPAFSIKEYTLKQKEIESLRFFAVLFSILILVSLFLGFVFDFEVYFSFFLLSLFTFISLTILRERNILIHLGKDIGSFSLIWLWTLLNLYFQPTLGRVIILGYILVFIIMSTFRNRNSVILSGIFSFLSYGVLYFNFLSKEVFNPILDLSILGVSCGIIALITDNSFKSYLNLLDAQEEIEEMRKGLEIKVKARTKELEELAQTLEEKVKERTKELQEKTIELQKRVVELEEFHKLTVGREIKMIELKEEIERLKKELEKYKGRKI